jgi:hypothetical protein
MFVEIMREPAGQIAERVHLLRLEQRFGCVAMIRDLAREALVGGIELAGAHLHRDRQRLRAGEFAAEQGAGERHGRDERQRHDRGGISLQRVLHQQRDGERHRGGHGEGESGWQMRGMERGCAGRHAADDERPEPEIGGEVAERQNRSQAPEQARAEGPGDREGFPPFYAVLSGGIAAEPDIEHDPRGRERDDQPQPFESAMRHAPVGDDGDQQPCIEDIDDGGAEQPRIDGGDRFEAGRFPDVG